MILHEPHLITENDGSVVLVASIFINRGALETDKATGLDPAGAKFTITEMPSGSTPGPDAEFYLEFTIPHTGKEAVAPQIARTPTAGQPVRDEQGRLHTEPIPQFDGDVLPAPQTPQDFSAVRDEQQRLHESNSPHPGAPKPQTGVPTFVPPAK